MQEVRCGQCRKLLAYADFTQLIIKCPRCKFINNLERPRAPIKRIGDPARE